MIDIMNTGREVENWLDPQLWHACAGGMVQMPPVNSKVIYFPQGHIEHAQVTVDFKTYPRLPPLLPCRISSIKYLADRDSDEVFAKIKLVPLRPHELDFGDDGFSGGDGTDQSEGLEKPASFAKTLTQSDANNGGGFSVPRYCAETIFPRLDYSAEPPVQTILARDVHGVTWKFRHIYRGTPRRHLLTTGWSNFVNQKKLVAGDSIVFLRADNGDLCVGIRRAKKGIGGGPESPSGGWNSGPHCNGGGYSAFLRDDESRMMMRRMNSGSSGGCLALGPSGKVGVESVVEAANLAANGQPFEVVYYPRASTPEFCVKASAVKAAMRIQWCAGMRFKMAFETEDSSRISWFMGTISGVQVADPIHWSNSPWRLLQVAWDEPELLQNVKRVNPWLVEMVASMPSIHHMSPFSPPRKKLRIPQPHDFPFIDQLPKPSSPFCCLPNNNISAGIQGARHTQFGQSTFTNLSKFHSALFPALLKKHHEIAPPTHHLAFPGGHTFIMSKPNITNANEDVSCLLTMGSSNQVSTKKSDDSSVAPKFMLFGKPILTEDQISQTSSADSSSSSTPSKNVHMSASVNRSTSSSTFTDEGLTQARDPPSKTESGLLQAGHCKLFMESEEVDKKLANMFGIESPEMLNNVNRKPFSEFLKTARTLTALADAGGENLAR